MIRTTGRCRNQILELDQPVGLPEGTAVVIEIRPLDEISEEEGWSLVGMQRLEEEWDNPEDSIYDDWRKLYGLPPR